MMGTEADFAATPGTDEAGRLAVLRARLVSPMPDDRPWGWLGPLLVTAFGAFLRFNRLRVPRALIFDETYYAKDAWSILQHGVEWNLAANANDLIQAGHTSIFAPCSGSACGEYVVQPEVGKMLIAVGEWLFGLNSLGWRFSSAVFGSLAILLVCRIARRMTRSTLLGLAVGTKWIAAWYIVGFAGLGIAWDIGARRAAGLRSFVRGAFRDAVWRPLTFIVIPLVVYTVTWSNWLITTTGYNRNYAQAHGVNIPVISPLYSLYNYHLQAIQFGLGLSQRHPYQSQPWDWLLMTRPVAFFYQCYKGPVAGPADYCPKNYTGAEWSQEVLAIGTPAIWWGAMLALAFCLGWWLLRRDWRAGAVLLGVLAGWGPWFPLVTRTKFYYYALEFEPFLILSITLCLGLILGPAAASVRRRSIGAGIVGAYILCVLIMFWYFYSILAGQVIPYQDWLDHMWYQVGHGWI